MIVHGWQNTRKRGVKRLLSRRGKANNSIWSFNKRNPTELMEQVHSRCPSPRFPPDLTFICQRRYHQVQTRSSKEKQPAESCKGGKGASRAHYPAITADHKPPLLRFAYFWNQEKATTSSSASKGTVWAFSALQRNITMVVPSQRLSRYKKKSSLPWTVILALAPAESPHLKA